MKSHGVKYWYSIFLLLLLVTACGDNAVLTEYHIIPEPAYLVQKGRTFTLSTSTKLCFENLAQNSSTAKIITNTLRKKHVRPALIGQPTKNCITFTINDTVNTAIGDEGYLLQVKPEGIFISANTEAGIFYGFRTFIQMLPPDIQHRSYRRVTLPECTILDYPRYQWRGSHLDCCRHFFTVKEIKKHLDVMASYKFNRFHWHLADDQGWRIETDLYPQLNDIGSWRVDRSGQPWGEASPAKPNEEPTYGGYYSKQDIQEIVQYAAERHIEVVPEIDLTSHCCAILASYPELACNGALHSVALGPQWPNNALLCVGKDQTIEFLTNLLDEISDLFPFEYIHIGVSESSKEAWEQCHLCQSRMHSLGLSDENALQGWLIAQIDNILSSKGKHIIGWDDMLECPNLSPESLVMVSRGDSNLVRATYRNHGVIVCTPEYCNLDTYQADSAYHPISMPQYLPLHQVYQFSPTASTLAHDVEHNILGSEALLWTDYVTNYSEAQYMLLPRLCALAECFWTPSDKKDWSTFQRRIEHHKKLFQAYGYNYCKGSFRPKISKTFDGNNVTVTFTSEVADTYIYYTTDGSDPTPESAIYRGPITLTRGTKLRTITLYNGEIQEAINNFIL